MTSDQITAPAPVRAWDNPPAVGPRGTLVVLAGRGEHPGVYERFGTRIAVDAYRVRAVGDPAADPEGVTQAVVELLADESLPAPRVLVGSDGGALFAAGLVASGKVQVDGLILAGLPTADAAAATGSGGWQDELEARTACPTHQGRLDADGGVRRGAIDEPLPAAWFDQADLSRVTVPILGLHGANDIVSPVGAAREAYATAPHAEVVTIVGGRHDALNDATHRTAAAAVVLFLERLRLGADLPDIARWSTRP
jgi:alpha-beta hydrolase superfamily lysophospholipase